MFAKKLEQARLQKILKKFVAAMGRNNNSNNLMYYIASFTVQHDIYSKVIFLCFASA